MFDIIIGNPPYNQMIDLKFLRRSVEIYKQHLLFVHLATWLLDEKQKQSAFNKAREAVENNIRSIHLFNGNTVFGIGLFVPCVITHIDKEHDTKKNGIHCQDDTRDCVLEYNDIWSINKFSDLTVYPALKKKILDWCKKNDSLQDRLNVVNNKYISWVNVAQIRGNHTSHTFVPKDLKVEDAPLNTNSFGFSSAKEAENFLSYLKTDFARFCLSIYKNNQNLHRGELHAVPYVGYEKEWTDEELFEMFELTEDEISFIKKEIPKYYNEK